MRLLTLITIGLFVLGLVLAYLIDFSGGDATEAYARNAAGGAIVAIILLMDLVEHKRRPDASAVAALVKELRLNTAAQRKARTACLLVLERLRDKGAS